MTKSIAAFIWIGGLIGWYIIRHPFQRRARDHAVKSSLLDNREWALLCAATMGLFVIPGVYSVTGVPASWDRPFSPTLAWLALAPLFGALWLFRRSHRDLGRNWSVTLKLREQHELVKHGVYRLIRHPMYLSFFLLGIAQFLLIPNWLAGTAGLVGAGLLFGFRAFREEQMMIDIFGEQYRLYMRETKRIIPWVI
jgi:protein-S-isoprenylcysteine O-methyltransferase Ste14